MLIANYKKKKGEVGIVFLRPIFAFITPPSIKRKSSKIMRKSDIITSQQKKKRKKNDFAAINLLYWSLTD